jgi:hypothetical protein
MIENMKKKFFIFQNKGGNANEEVFIFETCHTAQAVSGITR